MAMQRLSLAQWSISIVNDEHQNNFSHRLERLSNEMENNFEQKSKKESNDVTFKSSMKISVEWDFSRLQIIFQHELFNLYQNESQRSKCVRIFVIFKIFVRNFLRLAFFWSSFNLDGHNLPQPIPSDPYDDDRPRKVPLKEQDKIDSNYNRLSEKSSHSHDSKPIYNSSYKSDPYTSSSSINPNLIDSTENDQMSDGSSQGFDRQENNNYCMIKSLSFFF